MFLKIRGKNTYGQEEEPALAVALTCSLESHVVEEVTDFGEEVVVGKLVHVGE
jgi:hypothetical protein